MTKTFEQKLLENEYKDYIDDIVKSILEHYEELDICDKELVKLIEEVK